MIIEDTVTHPTQEVSVRRLPVDQVRYVMLNLVLVLVQYQREDLIPAIQSIPIAGLIKSRIAVLTTSNLEGRLSIHITLLSICYMV